MLESVSFFHVLAFLVVGILAVVDFFYRGVRAEQLLGQWAAKEGFELIESDRCFFETGPFQPFSQGVVYRIKAKNPEGKVRSGWIRCGGWFFGPMSARTEVVWD